MFRLFFAFGLFCKVLDDLGFNKKGDEYDELAHFHRLYNWRVEQGDEIAQWVHDIYSTSLHQHVPLTEAVRELMNKG